MLSGLRAYLAALVAVVVLLGGLYWYAWRAGVRSEQSEQVQAERDALKDLRRVDRQTDDLEDAVRQAMDEVQAQTDLDVVERSGRARRKLGVWPLLLLLLCLWLPSCGCGPALPLCPEPMSMHRLERPALPVVEMEVGQVVDMQLLDAVDSLVIRLQRHIERYELMLGGYERWVEVYEAWCGEHEGAAQ